jgi:LAGLIDADG endonuclease
MLKVIFFINKDFRKSKSFNLTIMFRLVLHKDDLAVLEYFKYILQIGEIYPSKITDHNSVTWKIQRKENVYNS